MSDESYPLTTEGIAAARFGKAKNKYGVGITKDAKLIRTYNGVLYASKAEAKYAQHLDGCQDFDEIEFWVPQPKFRLGCPENVYIADFLIISADVWVVDVKGFETPKFKRDKKLWAKYGPCQLRIVTGGEVVEVIVPDGMKNE